MVDAAHHDAYAAEYDEQVRAYSCHIHDLLFGLCFEYVSPGQLLLDAGIGSGLSSQLFARAGLTIHGMDFSPAMLDQCRAKGFTANLVLHDVTVFPWPVPSDSFDHIISCGVFHFMPYLEGIFREARRIIHPGGVFGFTIKTPQERGLLNRPYSQEKSGHLMIYSHSHRYIEKVIASCQFTRLKLQRCSISGEDFSIWIIRST